MNLTKKEKNPLSLKEWKFLQTYMSGELTRTKPIVKNLMLSKTTLVEEVTKTVDNVELMTIIIRKIEKYLLGENCV